MKKQLVRKRVRENRITKAMLSEKYLNANTLNLGSNAGFHKKETWMESDSNFTGIAKYASKGKNIALDEMFIGRFKARNKKIEMYNSSSRHPSNDWLEGCNDDPNNQIVDENDAQTETGDETVQEDGPTMKFWIPRRLI